MLSKIFCALAPWGVGIWGGGASMPLWNLDPKLALRCAACALWYSFSDGTCPWRTAFCSSFSDGGYRSGGIGTAILPNGVLGLSTALVGSARAFTLSALFWRPRPKVLMERAGRSDGAGALGPGAAAFSDDRDVASVAEGALVCERVLLVLVAVLLVRDALRERRNVELISDRLWRETCLRRGGDFGDLGDSGAGTSISCPSSGAGVRGRSPDGERVRECLERWEDLLRVKNDGRLPKRPWAALVVWSWSPMAARSGRDERAGIRGRLGSASFRERCESRCRLYVLRDSEKTSAHWQIYQAHPTRQKMTRAPPCDSGRHHSMVSASRQLNLSSGAGTPVNQWHVRIWGSRCRAGATAKP